MSLPDDKNIPDDKKIRENLDLIIGEMDYHSAKSTQHASLFVASIFGTIGYLAVVYQILAVHHSMGFMIISVIPFTAFFWAGFYFIERFFKYVKIADIYHNVAMRLLWLRKSDFEDFQNGIDASKADDLHKWIIDEKYGLPPLLKTFKPVEETPGHRFSWLIRAGYVILGVLIGGIVYWSLHPPLYHGFWIAYLALVLGPIIGYFCLEQFWREK